MIANENCERELYRLESSIMKDVQHRNQTDRFKKKKLQSEIPSRYDKDDYGWLRCNTDPRNTASIFTLQEQMAETRVWKKLSGLIDKDKCQLCGERVETVRHLLAGCKKLAGSCKKT